MLSATIGAGIFFLLETFFFAHPNSDTCEHVSLSRLNTIESLFDLVKYGFWSGEETPGFSRPVIIRVLTAYSITAT